VGANDIDGDALSYTIGGTDAQYISVAGNGDLSFINTISYANPSDANGDNVYDFTIAVSDGSTSVTQSFQVVVEPGGSAPVFSGTTSDPSFTENSSITVQINASDPDGDPMSLTLSNPSGFTITSNSTGFEITNSSGLTAGTYNVQGVITDTNSLKTVSFSFEILVIAKGWQQLGVDLDGSSTSDFAGFSVSTSSDGTIVAVGSPNNIPGNVKVYKLTDASWSILGAEIVGVGSRSSSFGYSISLSADGTRLVVGSNNDNLIAASSGQVQVYEFSNNSWTQIGQDLNGQYPYASFGKSVDISDDGMSIIVGADNGESSGGNYGTNGNYGLFSVYKYITNTSEWEQVGDNIFGLAAGSYDGGSVQINNDGTRVVSGSYRHDYPATDSGYIRGFELVNNEWSLMGSVSNNPERDGFSSDAGEADLFGRHIAMNDDGLIVAVMAVGKDENGNASGQTQVFKWNGTNAWEQQGGDINGEAAGDHQTDAGSLALNSDGTILAIGSDLNDIGEGDSDEGQTRIFKYRQGNATSTNPADGANYNWWLVGEHINGESRNDRSGFSVDLSSDGKTVIIGAICNDGDTGNNVDCRGHARVYEYIE
jgi:hypothetical protein